MYRVYNLEQKEWINDGIYLPPNTYNDVYVLKKGLFGKKKLILEPDGKYVVHKDIEMCDKDGDMIYEGDYLQAIVANEEVVVGLVTYAHEYSCYILLCDKIDKFYGLGTDISDRVKIVGNVFDGYKEVNQDGEQAL